MERLLAGRRGGATVLFEEDFDLPPEAPAPGLEPEVIEPLFTAAELAAARAEAWQEADRHARAELAAADQTTTRIAIAAIADGLAETVAEARAEAENAAEAITHLLLAAFGAAFPTLCAHHGDAEVQAVLRRVLPSLYSEPKVTIRVAPVTADAVSGELARLDPDLLAQIQVVPADSLLPGDVRIAWRAGQAVRDTSQLWRDIQAILAPAGLLPPDREVPQPTRQETANVA